MKAIMRGFTCYKAKFVKLYCKTPFASQIVLAFLTLTLISSSNLIAANSGRVKIFALLRPDESPGAIASQWSELKDDAAVYGLSWRFRWRTVEPQEGQYNWELLDKAIEVSAQARKKVLLRVVAGIHTPEWVYQTGARPLSFTNTDLLNPQGYEKSMKMPIPWDEVYLAKWEKFIQAVGRRYNRNPYIFSVGMSGGGYIFEMNLPKAYDKWHQAGYSDEKLIAAWKRIIDAYQQAFPDIPTNLDINEPLGKKHSHVLKPVLAYVLATYPQKVYLQHHGLQADLQRDNPIRQLIREASSTWCSFTP